VGKSGMELLLTGRSNVTLDDKGRISLPAYLRKILGDNELTLTQNDYENSLWLFPTSEYQAKLIEYGKNTNILAKKDRDFRRRLYDSVTVEVDKSGRIQIPPEYREFAGLNKECIVLGQGEYIEIWDEVSYKKYLSESKEDFIIASEELGSKLKNRGANEE